jgi:hypothetical protein
MRRVRDGDKNKQEGWQYGERGPFIGLPLKGNA